MSTDPTILSCLMHTTGAENIQMCDNVRIQYQDTDIDCYICLGKHNLHFVSKEMHERVLGKKMSYLSIKKVALDGNTNKRLVVILDENRVDDKDCLWPHDEMSIWSEFRALLVERIGICWQAEYMYKKYQVAKFPVSKGDFPMSAKEALHNIDLLHVCPPRNYDSNFSFRGYSFWLREGFKDNTGMKGGTYIHNDGWEVAYGYITNKVIAPPEATVTIHVNDPISIMELEKDVDRDEIRTVATAYRHALCEGMGHVYVLVNQSYQKRMNRTGDLASWDGWEMLIRSEKLCVVCILLRRTFIPPTCDMSQDIAVLLTSKASRSTTYDTHEVLLDEARFIADSLSPIGELSQADKLYDIVIQARLDSLQLNEDAYCWFKGYLNMEPVHIEDARKFVKGCVDILDKESQLLNDQDIMKCEELEDVGTISDPYSVVNDMVSESQKYLGDPDNPDSAERRSAWEWRISRYLAYCIDGGLLGDRFTLANVVQACGKCGSEQNDRHLKTVVEYLLHLRASDPLRGVGGARPPLMQLLQDPEQFARCEFNERVMKVLLMEDYIKLEWRKRAGAAVGGGASSVHYEKLLAALLKNGKIGLGLRTLICRQILENISTSSSNPELDRKIDVLCPALVSVMESKNVNLVSCATAALVNLTYEHSNTKTLLMQLGCMKILIKQLKAKDEDLLLYSLYLLVNMTKTPQHRSVVVREGGVPLLVDILSSSYQDVLRRKKILTELCSVFGQMCNDPEVRGLLTDEYPVVSCLLWIFDSSEPNSPLKAKLLFALRQLCGETNGAINRPKIGRHVISTLMEELGGVRREHGEIAMNIVLLLIELSSVESNAKDISSTLRERLIECRMMSAEREKSDKGGLMNKGRFKQDLLDKVMFLMSRLREMEFK